MIGRKRDLPGLGQWRVITEQPPGENDCWICDRQVYSLIFWNVLLGKAVQMQVPEDDKDYILDQIREFDKAPAPEEKYKALKPFKPPQKNPILQEAKVDYDVSQNPEIYGTFTNWKPQRMYDIREFCNRVDRKRPNFFKLMQDAGLLDKDAESENDLPAHELEEYNHEWAKYYRNYIDIWKDVIQDSLPYKEPNLVNAKYSAMLENRDVPLYVYPCFMKTQKRYYAIRVKKKTVNKSIKRLKTRVHSKLPETVVELSKLRPKKQ